MAVTDDEADTVRAEVLAVRSGEIDVRIHWDPATSPARPGTTPERSSEPGREGYVPSVPLDHLIKELGFDPADFEKPEPGRPPTAT